MNVIETGIDGLKVIEPQVFGDHRGWFCETYSAKKLAEHGIDTVFVQDNHSYSATKGTIRGLHFQKEPDAQTKLVRCTRGRILDVVVDIRKGSPTYCKWFSIELTPENAKQLYIPKGFAHGFVTLTEDCELQYKVDSYYSPECDRSVYYADETFGIDWQVENPILSDKDKNAPLLKDSDADFVYKK